jgi:hypothetical protein
MASSENFQDDVDWTGNSGRILDPDLPLPGHKIFIGDGLG